MGLRPRDGGPSRAGAWARHIGRTTTAAMLRPATSMEKRDGDDDPHSSGCVRVDVRQHRGSGPRGRAGHAPRGVRCGHRGRRSRARRPGCPSWTCRRGRPYARLLAEPSLDPAGCRATGRSPGGGRRRGAGVARGAPAEPGPASGTGRCLRHAGQSGTTTAQGGLHPRLPPARTTRVLDGLSPHRVPGDRHPGRPRAGRARESDCMGPPPGRRVPEQTHGTSPR